MPATFSMIPDPTPPVASNKDEGYGITDLIPLEKLQYIQDAFAKGNNVASSLTDTEGLPITVPSNHSPVCVLIRATDKGLSNCIHSGKQLGIKARQQRAPIRQRCFSIGFSDAAAPVIITSLSGKIIYINPAFTTLTGYNRQELIGKNPRLLKSCHQDDHFYHDLWQTIAAAMKDFSQPARKVPRSSCALPTQVREFQKISLKRSSIRFLPPNRLVRAKAKGSRWRTASSSITMAVSSEWHQPLVRERNSRFCCRKARPEARNRFPSIDCCKNQGEPQCTEMFPF